MMDRLFASPQLFVLLIVVGTIAALALASVFLTYVVVPFHDRRDAAHADALIRPLGEDHYRYIGHDDRLRVRSDGRRADAEKKRREAAQIASGKPAPQIYLVVNE